MGVRKRLKWKPVDPNYYPNPKKIIDFHDSSNQLRLPKEFAMKVSVEERKKLQELGQKVTNREYVHPDNQRTGNLEFWEWKRKCLEQHKTTI